MPPEASSSTSDSLSNTSRHPIWEHFRPAKPAEAARNSKKQTIHYCQRCPSWGTPYTRNAQLHLLNIHSIAIETPERSIDIRTQLSIQDALSRAHSVSSERTNTLIRNAFNREAFIEQQTILIVRRRLPFSIVTWPEYRALCICLNPEVEDKLISSPTTVKQYIRESFVHHRFQLRELLQNAQSRIHLSSDLWTSPNRKAFLGVTVQWLDSSFILRRALISLPHVEFSHSGEMQAEHILDAIQFYGIENNVGWWVGDNAPSNDTCMTALSRLLQNRFQVRLKVLQVLTRITYIYRPRGIPSTIGLAASVISLISVSMHSCLPLLKRPFKLPSMHPKPLMTMNVIAHFLMLFE